MVDAVRRWRRNLDPLLAHELAVLVQTPGIPIEWMYAVFRFRRGKRVKLRRLIGAVNLADVAAENAVSVQPGDGFKLLAAAMPYAGPVPLWSKLDLEQDPRPDHEIAEALGGIDRRKVQR